MTFDAIVAVAGLAATYFALGDLDERRTSLPLGLALILIGLGRIVWSLP